MVTLEGKMSPCHSQSLLLLNMMESLRCQSRHPDAEIMCEFRQEGFVLSQLPRDKLPVPG